MVIKTDLCFFTECKVYPGHGIRYVRKDGKVHGGKEDGKKGEGSAGLRELKYFKKGGGGGRLCNEECGRNCGNHLTFLNAKAFSLYKQRKKAQ
eukprot:1383586-Amorphochlora_amoeboformis.AAC.1